MFQGYNSHPTITWFSGRHLPFTSGTDYKLVLVFHISYLASKLQGGLDDIGAATVRALMHWQYRTISKSNNSILHNLNALLGPETRDYISFYGLRTYGQLSDVGPMFTSQVILKELTLTKSINCNSLI